MSQTGRLIEKMRTLYAKNRISDSSKPNTKD